MKLVNRGRITVAFLAGGADTSYAMRPFTYSSNGSQSWAIYNSAFYTNMVTQAANYYDLVQCTSMKLRFVPALHQGSANTSYGRISLAISTDTAYVPGADLDNYSQVKSYPAQKEFYFTWNPAACAKSLGIPDWLSAPAMQSSSTAQYNVPHTLYMYFAAPYPATPNTVQVGDFFIEAEYVFKGRNA